MLVTGPVQAALVLGFLLLWSQLQDGAASSPKIMPRKCRLPPRYGRCKASLQNFYYSFQDSMCKTFTYSGCGGNYNNFVTLLECLYECQRFELLAPWDSLESDVKWKRDPPQRCKLRRARGWCRENHVRFYYDLRNRRCREFSYRGCGGNANNFKSFRECIEECDQSGLNPEIKIDPQKKKIFNLDTCQQPRDVGPCKAIFPRFYYDAKAKKCLPFNFGGCNGNRNNFYTLEECHRECMIAG